MNNEYDSEQPVRAGLSRRTMLQGAALGVIAAATTGMQTALANTQHPPSPANGPANPQGRFAGKVVLITGATSGIGKATAYAFAREGANVYFCGRRVELGKANEKEIRSFGGEATYQRADVRNEKDVAGFVRGCVQTYGRIDIAFNNAGVESIAAPIHEMPTDVWLDRMTTNASGVFWSMKYELHVMLPQGNGIIINTGSVSSEVGFATISPYNASKHAIASLTKVGALEYSDKNIRINGIMPGAVDTPMLERATQAFGATRQSVAADYPIKRIATPEEIARAVMWLSSDDATVVTGTMIDVTGGYLAG